MAYVNPGTFDVWISDTIPFQSAENSQAGLGTGNFDRWLWDTQHFPEWLGLGVVQELPIIAEPIPRGLMYVEQVKYTEPYSLQLIGGDDQRLETFLAQKGIRSEDDLRDSLDGEYHPKERPIVTPYPPEIRPPGGGTPGVLYPCGQVFIGFIGMYSGAVADIPECWALCDGTPPTPDLRDRFIVGAGGAYSPGDMGGSDTVDISHQHAVGTLVAANESTHTHPAGTFSSPVHDHGLGTITAANESAHTHADGTYAAANDTHNHADTFSIDNDAHTHDVAGWSSGESAHTHTSSGHAMTAPSVTTNVTTGGTAVAGAGHDHNFSFTISGGSEHSHASGTYEAASDTHNHGISGSVSNDTHGHDVTGTSAAGSAHTHQMSGSVANSGPHALTGTSGPGLAHTHTLSGNTATGGDTTHDNRPQFYSLAFIMRTT